MSEGLASPIIPQLQEMQQQRQQHEPNNNNNNNNNNAQMWGANGSYGPWYAANQNVAAYQQQYNQYYQYYMRYGMQQQQQQQRQHQGVTSSISMSNTPPGFSNAVISQQNMENMQQQPPLPQGPPPANQVGNGGADNQKNFGGIRFNLNQQKRLANAPNPLQPANMENNNAMSGSFLSNNSNINNNNNLNMSNNPNNNVNNINNNNNGISKNKKRKRNRNKNQIQQQQPQSQQIDMNSLYNNETLCMNSGVNSADGQVVGFTPAAVMPIVPLVPDLSKPPPNMAPLKAAQSVQLPVMAQQQQNQPEQQQQQQNYQQVDSQSQNSNNNNGMNPTDLWPESLNNYVTRCYAKCATDLDKDQIDICLKGKIILAANRGELWTRDWDNEPMPVLFSQAGGNKLKQNDMQISQQQHTPQNMRQQQNMSSFNNFNTAFNKNQQHQQQKHEFNKNANNKGISRSLTARLGQRNSVGHSSNHQQQQRDSRSKTRSPTDKYRKRSTRLSNRSASSSSKSSRSSSGSPRRKVLRSSSSSDRSKSSDGFVPFRCNGSNKKQKNKINQNQNNKQSFKLNKKNNKSQTNHNKAKANFYAATVGGCFDDDSDRLQQRAARFSQGGACKTVVAVASSVHGAQKHHNNNNNQKTNRKSLLHRSAIMDDDSLGNNSGDLGDLFDLHIVGTCRELEKSFLRLTKAPLPSEVRPIDVLTHSLDNVKEKWRVNHDYYYACDQLKSIRQDLTVQGIRDQFTMEVYETHARIAMEKGDHEEFNQCQTQLMMLYVEVGPSAASLEFIAYRILYYIFTKNTLDTTNVLRSIIQAQHENEVIAHALAFRSAWASGNYCKLFKLYKSAPLMAGHLIDWFIERERKNALKMMFKAYRPNLGIEYVSNLLAFESSEKCKEWLNTLQVPLVGVKSEQIDCKNAAALAL